ncbi:hypothetical protein PIB30_022614 [Stylosanthes scabra]|uniref:CCHC-type domain-containing protein n=1 Tax=Stylosanthes scabra TaxID=79078 RepID=A0ABU6S9Y4_9FABA|nr:hypothetical protein [Stylosanthes scabra]
MGMYMLKKKKYRIEYEGIHHICFKCGRVDHDIAHCPEATHKEGIAEKQNQGKNSEQHNKSQDQTKESPTREATHSKLDKGKQIIEEGNNIVGEWILIGQRQRRGKPNKNVGETSKQNVVPQKTKNQGRFNKIQNKDNSKKPQKTNSKKEAIKQPIQKENTNSEAHKDTTKTSKANQEKETIRISKSTESFEANNRSPDQISKAKHYQENWIEEEDTIPSLMDDGVEPTVIGLSNEGKPPDPMQAETECNKDVEMELNDKHPYKELLEEVDFSTPELNNLGDAEMET